LEGTLQKIDTYTAYWREIVGPDMREFRQSPADLRLAFHLAISLFHMGDWVYGAHKTTIDANFTYVDSNGATKPVHDEKTFANAIRTLNSDFELIRSIANSAKHLQLKKSSKAYHTHTASHAANTVSQPTGFGQGSFGQGPYGGTQRVMLEGPGGNDLEFQSIAASVWQTWESLAQKHGWQI